MQFQTVLEVGVCVFGFFFFLDLQIFVLIGLEVGASYKPSHPFTRGVAFGRDYL